MADVVVESSLLVLSAMGARSSSSNSIVSSLSSWSVALRCAGDRIWWVSRVLLVARCPATVQYSATVQYNSGDRIWIFLVWYAYAFWYHDPRSRTLYNKNNNASTSQKPMRVPVSYPGPKLGGARFEIQETVWPSRESLYTYPGKFLS